MAPILRAEKRDLYGMWLRFGLARYPSVSQFGDGLYMLDDDA